MVERIEEEIKGWIEGKEMDEKGEWQSFRGNRTAFKEGVRMRAKRLNRGHLILNCSDSGVTISDILLARAPNILVILSCKMRVTLFTSDLILCVWEVQVFNIQRWCRGAGRT